MSIISGPLPWIISVVAVALFFLGIDWRSRRRTRHLVRALAGALLLTGAVYIGQQIFGWIDYGFPDSDYLLVGAVMLAVSSLVFGGHVGWWRRSAALLAVPVTLMSVLVAINSQYGYFPTVDSLFGVEVAHRTDLNSLQAERAAGEAAAQRGAGNPVGSAGPSGGPSTGGAQGTSAAPTPGPGGSSSGQLSSQPTGHGRRGTKRGHMRTGEMLEVSIPGVVSHFHARRAWIWVPPAYAAGLQISAPVLMLLAGTPGGPSNWIEGGGAETSLDHWAAKHDGTGPIVVMPDQNGSSFGDTECVDGSRGNADTYLTVDVPRFLARHFTLTRQRQFAIAGLSEGGTCSVMLALRHPTMFTAFGDFSGLTSPTPRDSVDPRLTAAVFFHGSLAEYDANDPLWLLPRHRYPGMRGIFVAGTHDHDADAAQRTLVPLCVRAGIRVSDTWLSGGHDFTLWRHALAAALPDLIGALAPPRLTVAPTLLR